MQRFNAKMTKTANARGGLWFFDLNAPFPMIRNESDSMRKIYPILSVITGFLALFPVYLLWAYWFQGIAKAQEDLQIVIPDAPQLIAEPQPMLFAADLLQQMYLSPVTYEAPIWSWSGDMDKVPNGIGDMITIPKRRSFTMPSEANPRVSRTLDANLLQRIVNAYQEQTDGPRFRIYSSPFGLHLIPDQVRDHNGLFVKAIPFLDTFISVPVEKRTPAGHVRAICNAINVSSATGIELKFAPQYLDAYYSQERISRFPSEEELKKISFLWGTDGMVARDALIDFLERSATTMTWRLLCDTREICALNVLPITIRFMRSDGIISTKSLFHDKKEKND